MSRGKWAIVIAVVSLVAAIGAVTYTAAKAGEGVSPVVRAERFEVVDSEGKVRIVLGMDRGFPRLVLRDGTGKGRAALVVDNNRAVVALRDEEGDELDVQLEASDTGPGLFLEDKESSGFATLMLEPPSKTLPVALFMLGQGEAHVSMGAHPGRGHISVTDGRGDVVWATALE